MGGGDADAFRRVERVRREFNRLHIQPQGTTQQSNPFFLEPQAMPQQFGCFNRLVFQPHTTTQLMTREATLFTRRVYVGDLPPSANEQTIGVFFNQVMAVIGGNTAGPGDAVCGICMNHEQRFALVEFRMAEEASNAMALDGILFEGVPVKVRRPADYNLSQAAAMGPTQPSRKLNLAAVGLTAGSAGGGSEDPDRIFVGGLPYYYSEAQVRDLLECIGPLRGFELVKDRETGNSKGYAFCAYMDTTATDIACADLNGIKMGDKILTVRRANQSASQPRPEQESILLQAQQQVQLQATRHARHVYVGGLPPDANEQTVAVYFNQIMAAIGGNTAGPGDAVLNVYINHDKKFASVEMRSVEEASNAMALDGIMFEGVPVKVRRPTDYNPSLAAALGPSQPSPNLNLAAVGLTAGSTGGLEGPDRIFVGGLPYYFTEAQVRELLESFGPLRGFDLVKDRETGNSKGYAFCVYQDLTVTDIACAALNGIKMGDKTLTVRRANQGASQPRPEQESILLQAQQQVQLQKLVYQVGALPTKVVCLTQVVTADELKDDEEYEDIMEDMRLEAGKYGTLVKVIIPRPDPSGQPVAGVGKVFLEYADIDGAAKAKTALHGRKFGGNPVVAVCYAEDKFANGEYDG